MGNTIKQSVKQSHMGALNIHFLVTTNNFSHCIEKKQKNVILVNKKIQHELNNDLSKLKTYSVSTLRFPASEIRPIFQTVRESESGNVCATAWAFLLLCTVPLVGLLMQAGN